MVFFNVVFVNQGTIRRLNKKYRQLDQDAAVLTFYYGEEKGQAQWPKPPTDFSADCLGEILISLKSAAKKNLKTEDLIIHGFRNLLSQIPATDLKRLGQRGYS